MNEEPKCEWGECLGIGYWTVIDKTSGKTITACDRCVGDALQHGHTYSIFPAMGDPAGCPKGR